MMRRLRIHERCTRQCGYGWRKDSARAALEARARGLLHGARADCLYRGLSPEARILLRVGMQALPVASNGRGRNRKRAKRLSASHPSHKDKNVARVGHPGISVA